jgi:hypothetical protein
VQEPATSHPTLVAALRESLESRGYVVADGVGLSRFKVDLAVRKPEDTAGWRVAVIADGPAWASLPTVADREGSPALLESIMRWPAVERVWLPAWLRNRDDVIAHLVSLVEKTDPFDPHSEIAATTTAEVDDETVAALTAENRAEGDAPSEPAAPIAAVAAASAATAEAAATTAPAAPAEATPAVERLGAVVTRPSFTRFQAADVTAVGHAATLDNPRLAAPAISRYADEILSVEGPTSSERLARLIGARFGLSRVVERRRADILAVVAQHCSTTEGGAFVWPQGIAPSSWTDVARSDPEGARTFAEISLHELVNGVVILLRQAFSMTADELATEVVRAFGFVRVTPAVRSRVEKALQLGVESQRLRRHDDRVELA